MKKGLRIVYFDFISDFDIILFFKTLFNVQVESLINFICIINLIIEVQNSHYFVNTVD